MNIVRKVATVVLVLSGCAAHIDEAWFDAAGLRDAANAETDREASAVVLENKERIISWVDGNRTPHLEELSHRATLIRTEDGLDVANFRLAYHRYTDLAVRARTLQPDGTIRDVQPAETIETATGKDGKVAAKFRIFRFPNVSVGSILEVMTEKRVDSLLGGRHGIISEAIPVRHFRLEISLPVEVGFDVRAYRLPEGWTNTRGRTRTYLTLETRDVRADPEEEWMPPALLRDPFWILRITGFPFGDRVLHYQRDWGAILSDLANRMYVQSDKRLPEIAPRVDTTGSRDEVIARLLVSIRDGIRLSGFADWDAPRARAEILGSRRATATEKTFLLWAALRDAGIEARFAATARTGTQFMDGTEPFYASLNHLILYVPPDKQGVARWLDPSCEVCGAGELPYWLQNATAVTFVVDGNGTSTEVATEVLPVTGTVRLDMLIANRTELTLDATGAANLSLTETATGAAAMEWMRATHAQTDADKRKSAEAAMRARDPRAEAVDLNGVSCDYKTLKCTRKLSFNVPQLATAAGEQLILPLRLVGEKFATLFASEAPRRGPALVDKPLHWREVLVVTLPSGFVVHDPPRDVSVTEGEFSARCFASRVGTDWTWTRELIVPPSMVPVKRFAALRRVVRTFAECREANLVAQRQGK